MSEGNKINLVSLNGLDLNINNYKGQVSINIGK